MVEIKWQDPPAALTRHDSIVAALKNNPGRWALVAEDRSSSSSGTPWNKSGCETKVHRKNPGEGKAKYDVYARWPEKKPLPVGRAVAGAAAKPATTGTALIPPRATLPPPKASGGYSQFLANQNQRRSE
jgi:hypothetical protein